MFFRIKDMKQELERDLFGYQKEDAEKITEPSEEPLLDSSWCTLTPEEIKWLLMPKAEKISKSNEETKNSKTHLEVTKLISKVTKGRLEGSIEELNKPYENNSEYIKCEICGGYFGRLSYRHLKTHSLTLSEYEARFPNFPTYSEGLRKRQKFSHMGIERSEATRDLVTSNNLKMWADLGFRLRNSIAIRKSMESPEFRDRRSQISKDNWQDPEYVKKTMEGKNLGKGNIQSPNKGEVEFWLWVHSFRPDSIIFNKEWIQEARLTPDFLVVGKKKVIEYFGSYWHDPSMGQPGYDCLREEEYYIRYKKAGLELFIVWSDELYMEDIKKKLEEFIDG
jgi:hypothetical protein